MKTSDPSPNVPPWSTLQVALADTRKLIGKCPDVPSLRDFVVNHEIVDGAAANPDLTKRDLIKSQ